MNNTNTVSRAEFTALQGRVQYLEQMRSLDAINRQGRP